MADSWSITGDYVEACNCDVSCQCVLLEPPDDDACAVSFAWRIEDGRYGDVDLSGLHAAMLVRSEEGVLFDPAVAWHMVVLVDETADDDQRAALEDVLLGRAGGIFAAAADTHVERAEVATAPFSFTRNDADFSVEVGDVVSMEVVGKYGFNDELGTIAPHPFTKDREMSTGKSTTATVSYDDEFTWDVSGNNAFFCEFELANG
ncbi:DUF1326 domain-containing protein [Halorarum halophilum]|uniref:DUF1326 domain-containing protein n=1 Tax=Halorarum halophilum TaxID=2743090 RepID=A0A7D5GYR6_9EURY|nr:DUF1326 domain-containing protein [Halobaculum halophilum]QLG28889.1 DUF1326 domain-containing protein [Halobaculum halophilum]